MADFWCSESFSSQMKIPKISGQSDKRFWSYGHSKFCLIGEKTQKSWFSQIWWVKKACLYWCKINFNLWYLLKAFPAWFSTRFYWLFHHLVITCPNLAPGKWLRNTKKAKILPAARLKRPALLASGRYGGYISCRNMITTLVLTWKIKNQVL